MSHAVGNNPILTVSPEIYKLLDPLERSALHQMAAEGWTRIFTEASEGKA